MFDDHHRITRVDKPVQHLQQLLNVGEVQPRRRLVQEIERAARGPLAQFAGQLDSLRFAPGERRRWLPELDVVEADVVQCLQQGRDVRNVLEVLESLLHVHLEDFGDRLSFVTHLERFSLEAGPLADGTGHPHIGEEIHLQAVRTPTFARLAAAVGDVEAEAARLEAAHFRFGQLREQVANQVEELDVRGRIGPRRPADGRLVDVDGFIELIEAGDFAVRAGPTFALVQIAVECFPENVVNERAFARPADAGNADEILQGKRDVDVAQVVVLRPGDFERLLPARPPLGRNRNDQVTREVFSGEALGLLAEILDGPLRDDLAAANSGPGSEVDHVVGCPHRFFVVLDHDDSVSLVAQVLETVQK